MAQNYNKYNTVPQYFIVKNINLFLPNEETIVLDSVDANSGTHFALTVKNYGPGDIQNVKIYGSPNGKEYYLLENNLFSSTINDGYIDHSEFTCLTSFLRATITADMDGTHVDIYMRGV